MNYDLYHCDWCRDELVTRTEIKNGLCRSCHEEWQSMGEDWDEFDREEEPSQKEATDNE